MILTGWPTSIPGEVVGPRADLSDRSRVDDLIAQITPKLPSIWMLPRSLFISLFTQPEPIV